MRFIFGLFVLIILTALAGCGRDLDQSRRYAEMKSECDSTIAQADLVIKDQKAKADSLRKMRDDGLKVKIPEYKLSRIEKGITNAVTIASNVDMIRKHLEAIKTFAKIGETVNKRIIYYKRTYVNYSTTIQVHDEYLMIQEITDGLSAKQYIARYLPEGPN
jgi:microsomal dipeptidase-like Zn-dependent dipeptidase